jgi:hypothetical protein
MVMGVYTLTKSHFSSSLFHAKRHRAYSFSCDTLIEVFYSSFCSIYLLFLVTLFLAVTLKYSVLWMFKSVRWGCCFLLVWNISKYLSSTCHISNRCTILYATVHCSMSLTSTQLCYSLCLITMPAWNRFFTLLSIYLICPTCLLGE